MAERSVRSPRWRGGEVGAETVFEYHQDGDLVWARYTGGSIRLGHLVGTRDGDTIDFRYSQLKPKARPPTAIAGPRCTNCRTAASSSRETWEWESRAGTGTCVVEEVTR